MLKFEKLFTQLYVSNTDIHQYYRKEDLPKLTRKEKIAPNIDEQMELQTALEDHFSKQALKNVCEYTLPSIKTME